MSHSATWPHVRRSIGGNSERELCAPVATGLREDDLHAPVARPPARVVAAVLPACSAATGSASPRPRVRIGGASAPSSSPQRAADRGRAAAAEAEVVARRALGVRVAGDRHERRLGLGDLRRRLGDPRLRLAGERRAVEREQHVGGERHLDPLARLRRGEAVVERRGVEREVLHGQREVEHAVRRAGLRERGRRRGEQQRRRRAAAARLLGDRDVTERLEVRDQQVDLR